MKPFKLSNFCELYEKGESNKYGKSIELTKEGIKSFLGYYNTKYKLGFKNPNDLIIDYQDNFKQRFLLAYHQLPNKNREKRLGFIYRNERHSTPFFYLKKDEQACFFVSDSLGDQDTCSNSQTLIELISLTFPKVKIYYTDIPVQADSNSCHLGAIYYIKELLNKDNNGKYIVKDIIDELLENYKLIKKYSAISKTKSFRCFQEKNSRETSVYDYSIEKWEEYLSKSYPDSFNNELKKALLKNKKAKTIARLTLPPLRLLITTQSVTLTSKLLKFFRSKDVATENFEKRLAKNCNMTSKGKLYYDFMRVKGLKIRKIFSIVHYDRWLMRKTESHNQSGFYANSIIKLNFNLFANQTKHSTGIDTPYLFSLKIKHLALDLYTQFLKDTLHPNNYSYYDFEFNRLSFSFEKNYTARPKGYSLRNKKSIDYSFQGLNLLLAYYIKKYSLEFKNPDDYLVTNITHFKIKFTKALTNTRQDKTYLRLGFLFTLDDQSIPVFYFSKNGTNCFLILSTEYETTTRTIFEHIHSQFPEINTYFLREEFYEPMEFNHLNALYWFKELLRKNEQKQYLIPNIMHTLKTHSNQIKDSHKIFQTILPLELWITLKHARQNIKLFYKSNTYNTSLRCNTVKSLQSLSIKLERYEREVKGEVTNNFLLSKSLKLLNKLPLVHYYQETKERCQQISHLNGSEKNRLLRKFDKSSSRIMKRYSTGGNIEHLCYKLANLSSSLINDSLEKTSQLQPIVNRNLHTAFKNKLKV